MNNKFFFNNYKDTIDIKTKALIASEVGFSGLLLNDYSKYKGNNYLKDLYKRTRNKVRKLFQ